MSTLIADDPSTHLVILCATSGVSDPITTRGTFPTRPVWGGDQPPWKGTSLTHHKRRFAQLEAQLGVGSAGEVLLTLGAVFVLHF